MTQKKRTGVNANTVSSVILLAVVALFAAVFFADGHYMPKLKAEFEKYNKQMIEVANELTTARIINEDLFHVRDLVYSNMSFPELPDSVDHETQFFAFITECVNDLKLKLISVSPVTPVTAGRITTYGYDVEVYGDFFRFGELNAKFENNRRIISVESFNVVQLTEDELQTTEASVAHGVRVRMRINTYRVRKI